MKKRTITKNPGTRNGPPPRPSGAVFIASILLLPLLALPQSPALAQGGPTISYFSPTGGPAGTLVTVVGEHLANNLAYDLRVTINGVESPISSLTDQTVTFVVADGTTTGPIDLTTSAGAASTAGPFVVSPLTVVVEPARISLFPDSSRSIHASVLGDPLLDVTWSVNGVPGGNAEFGTVTQANPSTYTAPAIVPAEDLLIRAASAANPDVFASVRVSVVDPAGGIPDMVIARADPADFTQHPDIGLEVSRTRVLLSLAGGASAGSLQSVLSQYGGEIVGGIPEFDALVITISDTGDLTTVSQAVDALAALPSVESAEHDVLMQAQSVPRRPDALDLVYVRGSVGDFYSTLPGGVPMGFGYTHHDSDTLWKWDWNPDGANWGYEYCNFPQAWNWYRYVNKIHENSPFPGRLVSVGVVDLNPIKQTHQDLAGIVTRLTGPKIQSGSHGTHVAGTIGANWTDGVGFSGASPFVRIFDSPVVAAGDLFEACRQLARNSSGIRVINMSLGYGWFDTQFGEYDAANNTMAGSTWKWALDADNNLGLWDLIGLPAYNPRQSQLVQNHGETARKIADWFANPASGHNAIFVISAGNDRTDIPALLASTATTTPAGVLQDYTAAHPTDPVGAQARRDEWLTPGPSAEYNNCFAYAAYNGAGNILVVEALDTNSSRDNIDRASFSNIARPAPRHPGWNLGFSAPGVKILHTSVVDVDGHFPAGATLSTYQLKSGTSMAAPHVTGLIAYLCAVDPDLSIGDIITVLQNSSRPFGAPGVGVVGAPVVDAFEAVMQIDELNAGDPAKRKWIKKALLNIDDGTVDGNDRLVEGDAHGSTDAGGFTPDFMTIDMSDFRRFRDADLQVNGRDHFNGPVDSPKKDLNGDGFVETPAEENVYPRVDFDGDGWLTDDDLAVMADVELWDDDVVDDAGLTDEELLNRLAELRLSADIKLDADDLFANAEYDIDNIRITARVRQDNAWIYEARVTLTDEDIDGPEGDERRVITLPASLGTVVRSIYIDGKAYNGNEERFYVSTHELIEGISPLTGEDKHFRLRKGAPVFTVDSVAAEYNESACLNLAVEFDDGTSTAIETHPDPGGGGDAYTPFTVTFDYSPDLGSIQETGECFLLTTSSHPDEYSIQAQVRTETGTLINPFDSPFAETKAFVRTAVIREPAGLALDSRGNMYVSDSEEGDITFIPPQEEGLAFIQGLDSPGDVEVDARGRSVIIAEANGKVSRYYFGLSGRVTNPAGHLLVFARVYVDTPAGTIPGDAHDEPYSRIETKEDGRFHVLGLLAPEMGFDPVEVVVTIEYEEKSQAFPITLEPVGQTVMDFVFDPPE
jgi:hypothetical protein